MIAYKYLKYKNISLDTVRRTTKIKADNNYYHDVLRMSTQSGHPSVDRRSEYRRKAGA